MYCPAFICLSVCLLAVLRKNYLTDLQENFTADVYLHVYVHGGNDYILEVISLRIRIGEFFD